MAADMATVVVSFTDFSEAYYLITKLPPVAPALPGTWGVVLLAILLLAVALAQRARLAARSRPAARF